jgi:hypothetical protein
VVVVVVLGVVAAVVLSTRGDSGDSTEACGLDTRITQELPKGDVRLLPFSSDSVWRAPLGDGDPPDGSDASPQTLALRLGSEVDSPDSTDSWINAEQYSLPVVQADACDPLVTFDVESGTDDLGDAAVRIPDDAEPAQGTDAHLLVIQPDHRTVVEMWTAEHTGPGAWKAGRVEVVDLKGSGIGPDNGVRAYGGSALGGLIRTWEIDPDDPNFTDGVIRHPLAMALPSSMLSYTGGDPGYDEAGNGTALGYVAPATEQDYDSPWTYGGPIPMGSRIVLPHDVDLDSLDLSPEQRAIAQALQDYGAYVTDRTSDGTVAFYAEPTAPTAWLDVVRGPDDTGDGLDRIRARLVVLP